MKVILLAAGYSRRLGELTQNTPKALLPVNGKPVMEYLVEKIEKLEGIQDVYLVTNDKYYNNFVEWNKSYKGRLSISVLNDLTTSNENRLGAIGDIMYTLDHYSINDDVLVTATDSYFEFDLKEMLEKFYKTGKDVVMAKKYDNREELKRMGVASIEKDGKITLMEEKPAEPKSDIAIFATYMYKKQTLPLFEEYKKAGNNMDAPGNFVSWLYKKQDVLAHTYNQDIYDIGTVDSYEEVNDKVNK